VPLGFRTNLSTFASRIAFSASIAKGRLGFAKLFQNHHDTREEESKIVIQRMSHTTIYVIDQDQAKEFYVDKLGFEVKADYSSNGFRRLTVAH
jgi:catechol-2,3-dioxygenase